MVASKASKVFLNGMAAEVGFDPHQPTAASGAEIITLQCSVSFHRGRVKTARD
jgi:hypothetical protein